MQYLRASLIASLIALAACSHGEAPEAGSQPQVAASAHAPPVAEEAPRTVEREVAATHALDLSGMEGYGDTRFGMDEAQFKAAWGGDIKKSPPARGSSCYYAYPFAAKGTPSLSFMFEDGHFARYDVRTNKETAPGGGMVGMSRAALLALYAGKFEEQPAKYEPRASTIRVPGAQGGALVFDVGVDGKVTQWRVGLPPQVDYVEGCG